jgi:hypothetical protein
VVTYTLWAAAACAGDTAVISVEDATVKLVAATEPKTTLVAPVKLVPVMVTVVPPAGGPEVGEREVIVGVEGVGVPTITLPASSPATHREALAHATLVIGWVSTALTAQADAAPVGLVEVTTLPEVSTATHRLEIGHEMPVRKCEPSASIFTQSEIPPAGSVETTMLPEESTPTQRNPLSVEALVHEMPVRKVVPSTSVSDQADAPPVGLVEVKALPKLPTATHREAVGHEML